MMMRKQFPTYVLGRFSPEEFEALPPIIDKACEAVLSFCLAGLQTTMNQYNG